jgi:formylglycine-generating enzyme required for sulfatase activity
VTTGIGLKLTYIPPGSFTMGAQPGEPGAKPAEKQHKVTLSKGYYLGIYEVTQDQYSRVLGSHWAGLLDHQFSKVPHCHRAFSIKLPYATKSRKALSLQGM